MSELRVHPSTYEFFESELLRTITSGAPTSDVCDAARALVQNCFKRRSFAEWFLDHLPAPLLCLAEQFAARRSAAADRDASAVPARVSTLKLSAGPQVPGEVGTVVGRVA